MCTVTFVPTSDGFFFTSNRDEAPGRSPDQLTQSTIQDTPILFPRDTKAGGTWIAVTATQRLICILNGAFEWHPHRPPYRRSRGLMALDFFYFPKAADFIGAYPFAGMEPFTLISWEKGQLWDIRWDGEQVHHQILSPQQSHIWSSATLYPPEVKRKREQWFQEWAHQFPVVDEKAVRHFHKNAGEGDPATDVVMNRANIVRTVSTTLIRHHSDHWLVDYHELVQDKHDHNQLLFQG